MKAGNRILHLLTACPQFNLLSKKFTKRKTCFVVTMIFRYRRTENKYNVRDACLKVIEKHKKSTKHVTCSYIWHVKMCILIRHTICESLVEIQSDMNGRQLSMKIPKKWNKTKRRSITCTYIWHIDISKSVYQLNTHSVKVWWSYVLPNTNAVHFCDIEQCFHHTTKNSVGNQKSGHGNF